MPKHKTKEACKLTREGSDGRVEEKAVRSTSADRVVLSRVLKCSLNHPDGGTGADAEAGGNLGINGFPITRVTTGASQGTIPPPDGGLRAWLVCLAGHIVMANTWGIINSFGIFQAYYTDLLGLTPTEISWIGSLQFILGNLLGVFSGRLSDAGHFRVILAIGSALLTVGLFATSFCTTYWQLLLAQGVVIGTAAGFLKTDQMLEHFVTSTYFSTRRSLAVGIVTCGNVTGGLIYPALARQLLPTLGFGWALRVVAFTQLGLSVFVNLVARDRIRTAISGPILNFSLLRSTDFVLFIFGGMLGQGGNYVGLYYLPQFSRTQITPPLSYPNSLNLLLLFNGVSFFGRIIPSRLADTLGAVNLMIPSMLMTGIHFLGWIGVTTPAGVYAWTVVYGLVGGSMMGLYPAATMSLSKDLRSAGTRMGMAMGFNSLAILLGPPVAGAIITEMDGRYQGAQAYAGSLLVLASCVTLGVKLARNLAMGEKWAAKV